MVSYLLPLFAFAAVASAVHANSVPPSAASSADAPANFLSPKAIYPIKDQKIYGGYELSFPPSSLYKVSTDTIFSSQARDIYLGAERAMTRCSEITESFTNPTPTLARLFRELNVRGEPPERPVVVVMAGEKIPPAILRSYVRDYAAAVRAAMLDSSEPVGVSRKWISRLLVLKKMVHSVPCSGTVPAPLVTIAFDAPLTHLMHRLYRTPETRDAEQDVERIFYKVQESLTPRTLETATARRDVWKGIEDVRDAVEGILARSLRSSAKRLLASSGSGSGSGSPSSSSSSSPAVVVRKRDRELRKKIVDAVPFLRLAPSDEATLFAWKDVDHRDWMHLLRDVNRKIVRAYRVYLDEDKSDETKFRNDAVLWRTRLVGFVQFHDFLAKSFDDGQDYPLRESIDTARASLANIVDYRSVALRF